MGEACQRIFGIIKTGVEMKKNILLFKADSVYGTTRNYIEELEIAFHRMGYNTAVVDLNHFNYQEICKWYLENYEFIVMIDCQEIHLKVFEKMECPKGICRLSISCDHPMYHHESLECFGRDNRLISIDEKHNDYVKKYYSNIKDPVYIPLAGSSHNTNIPWGRRDFDVLFTGSYWKPQPVLPDPIPDDFSNQLQLQIQNQLLKGGRLSIDEIMEEIFSAKNIEVSKKEFKQILFEISDLEHYVRQCHRDQLMRILLKEGICVHVFGNGWEDLDCPGKENLVIHKGNLEIAKRALGNAKIVLNIMPGFKAGFQERIASGMLSKALVVTDSSDYIDREFVDGENIILYYLSNMEELPGHIKELLANEKESVRIAQNGYEKAIQSHTWSKRAWQIIEYLINQGVDCETDSEEGIYLQCECMYEEKLRNIGIEVSSIVKKLSELYSYGYVEFRDIQRGAQELVQWNERINQIFGVKFMNGNNFKASIKFLLENIEKEEDVKKGALGLIYAGDALLSWIRSKNNNKEH